MSTRLAAAVTAALAACAAAAAAPTSPHVRTLRFVDETRRAHYRNGTSGPRVLVTEVRYPRGGGGPFPLIVFAHGFAVTPDDYAVLLDAWAAAGYVVAAPEFPVEGAGAPGGPDRSDLGNEAADLRFVITRLTSATSPVRKLIAVNEIAVAGQSDGGVAALGAAYDARHRDRRIDAAAILSGAAPPGFGPASVGPPLLAMQGTADPYNPPSSTTYYFDLVHRPKFLVWLLGAPHREPYSTRNRWAPVVRATTIAFFDHYLRGKPLRPLIVAASRSGTARIVSEP